MEEEQKELGFADIMKELAKIMESLQKIIPTQTEPEPQQQQPETESEPTPAPQPEPEKEEPETDDTEENDVGDADEIDKILKDC